MVELDAVGVVDAEADRVHPVEQRNLFDLEQDLAGPGLDAGRQAELLGVRVEEADAVLVVDLQGEDAVGHSLAGLVADPDAEGIARHDVVAVGGALEARR